MWKWIFLVSAVVILVSLCLFINRQSETEVVHPEPTPQTEVWGFGRMEGVSEEIYLGFLIPGKVEEIKVAEGDHVKVGDPLVILENQEYRNRVLLAEANKKLHEFQRQFDVVQRERLRKLLPSRSVSEEDVERGDLQVQLSGARIGIAEAETRVAKDILEKTTLKAPIDGQIISIDVELGEYVGQQPVLVMADTSKFFVRAFIDEIDVTKVQVGMKATITLDSSEEELHGVVVRRGYRMTTKEIITNEPTERMDTKVRELWIELIEPNEELLIVGLRVDVEISLNKGM